MKIYLVYLKNKLYAYTPDKKVYKLFKSTRKNLYRYKTKDISKDEYTNLIMDYSEMMLQNFANSFKLPVTYTEKITTINEANNEVYINIYVRSLVNPNIFKSKFNNTLKEIKYTDVYSVFGKTGEPLDGIDPDYNKYFIYKYDEVLDIENVLKLYGG